jgi:hypothetical protein
MAFEQRGDAERRQRIHGYRKYGTTTGTGVVK